MRKLFLGFKTVFQIVCWLTIIALIFLPVFMQGLSNNLFGASFAEFASSVKANDAAVLLTVIAISAIAMIGAGYTYSITGVICKPVPP